MRVAFAAPQIAKPSTGIAQRISDIWRLQKTILIPLSFATTEANAVDHAIAEKPVLTGA
jgi:hypothetical protein